jgi:hypothetical protein
MRRVLARGKKMDANREVASLPAEPPKVLGRIVIQLNSDGQVQTKADVPDQIAFLGMIEVAKASMVGRIASRPAPASPIAVPSPALSQKLLATG